MLSRCEYKECEKYTSCGRVSEGGTIINFKQICPNQNYKWYMKVDEIVVVDDIKDDSKEDSKEEQRE